MKALSFKVGSRLGAPALVMGLLAAALLAVSARAADEREAVTLPAEVKDAFLAEMRDHMTNLNDIVSALADGDFKQAGDIADRGMGGGRGQGMGRYMPPDFRAMGQAFHEAAGDFAAAARAAGAPPSLADYRSVMDGLQALTANCLGCHETYRIE